jgi:metal-responsive CopG/Arc/MetJ family transcriptional regulator
MISMKTICLKVPEDLAEQIDRATKILNINKSELLRIAIKLYLEQNEKRLENLEKKMLEIIEKRKYKIVKLKC